MRSNNAISSGVVAVIVLVVLIILAFLVLRASNGPTPTLSPTLTNTVTPPTPPIDTATQTPVILNTATTVSSQIQIESLSEITGEVTFWYVSPNDSDTENALVRLVEEIRRHNPAAIIELVQISSDDWLRQYIEAIEANSGPDLLLAPNAYIDTLALYDFLLPLEEIRDYLKDVVPAAIAVVTIDGRLYAVPYSLATVALYSNDETVPNPPRTTEELLTLVKDGRTIAIFQDGYFLFGLGYAYGGTPFNDNGLCVADERGWSEALVFLKELHSIESARFLLDYGEARQAFGDGHVDMIIDGPWALSEYRDALKDNLDVSPLPRALNPASPIVELNSLFINKNSANLNSAMALALSLTSSTATQEYFEAAQYIPADQKITINDPLMQSFAVAVMDGFPYPPTAALDKFLLAFDDAIDQVLLADENPLDAMRMACQTANSEQ